MKTKWLLIGGVVVSLGILIGAVTTRTAVRHAPKSPTKEHVSFPGEQTEPVGWVFGRMIGFPGADKPLLPQSGNLGHQVYVSPTSDARP